MIHPQKHTTMTEKEMNAYRLTSLEEPTDEMLSQLMREAAADAKERSERTHAQYFKTIEDDIRRKIPEWSRKYNLTFPGYE